MRFYVGCHQVSDVRRFDRAFLSVSRLRDRVGMFGANRWILDSGAFSQIVLGSGDHELTPGEYAAIAHRFAACGDLERVVTQDYMCEPEVLALVRRTVREHQRLTLQRFDELRERCRLPVMPVLQGYEPREYVEHLQEYGDRLGAGEWVGVGSVCKRNGRPGAVRAVLEAITAARPDLRLHGFGLKLTALHDEGVRRLLWSADSLAWSMRARYAPGRSGNDWREGERYRERIEGGAVQGVLL